jgi:hypothetical protein
MGLVLDAGSFVAVERGNREIAALVKRERLAGRSPITHGGVVGQVWRGGAGRQVMLARLLAGLEIRSLNEDLGKRAGVLLGLSDRADVVDAALVCLAADGDEILTSDPEDLVELARNAGIHVDLIAVH